MNASVIIANYAGGSLYLSGCDLKGITLPTSVSGSLDLSGCDHPNAVHNCGDENRTILAYNHPEKGLVVSLGCFIGNEEQCHEAINNKYSAGAAKAYCDKVSEAFRLTSKAA